MKIDLAGTSAIVSGSTAGIGLAIARGLAAAGAEVVINGRSQAAVDRAIATLREAVPDARLVPAAIDLSTAEGCARLVADIPSTDILVNNLGIYGPKDFFETDDATWTEFLETNVLSGVRLSRAYLKGMMERGWGRIVFVSSESALNIPHDMIHYGLTKTAQLALARGLAKLARGTGVTVNSVLPGPTLSDGLAGMLAPEVERSGRPLDEVAADFVKSARPGSLIERAASVEEVANMVVYACSREASATTGAALRVDGGLVDSL